MRVYVDGRVAHETAVHCQFEGRPRVANEDDEQDDFRPVLGKLLAWTHQFDPLTTKITVDMMSLYGEEGRLHLRSTVMAFWRKSGYAVEECAPQALVEERPTAVAGTVPRRRFHLPPLGEWDKHLVKVAVVALTLATVIKLILMKVRDLL
ncbi:MAG: hypothetical protein JST16_18220 [Bdellovibrionales bacterium]|nr:hypothetical protein [Bdellovibrionales bacterium]